MNARTRLGKAVGRNIVRAREAKGLTQAELARRIKRPRNSLHRWENGGPGPSLDTLNVIARACECDLASLISAGRG